MRANLAARLAAWAYKRNPAAVKSAFESSNLVVFKRSPKRHYVLQYFGGMGPEDLYNPLQDPVFAELWDEVRLARTTLLFYDRLYVLYQALIQALAASEGPVEVLEVGVFRGGTSWFLGSAGERLAPGRVHVTSVDTFSGHSELDLPRGDEGPHKPAKFRKTSYERVSEYVKDLNVDVLEGRIQDVADQIDARPIALAHIDVDIYEPMVFSLEFVAARMEVGGIIVADDYGAVTCPGARSSVDEFVERQAGRFVKFELQTGQALLIRTRP